MKNALSFQTNWPYICVAVLLASVVTYLIYNDHRFLQDRASSKIEDMRVRAESVKDMITANEIVGTIDCLNSRRIYLTPFMGVNGRAPLTNWVNQNIFQKKLARIDNCDPTVGLFILSEVDFPKPDYSPASYSVKGVEADISPGGSCALNECAVPTVIGALGEDERGDHRFLFCADSQGGERCSRFPRGKLVNPARPELSPTRAYTIDVKIFPLKAENYAIKCAVAIGAQGDTGQLVFECGGLAKPTGSWIRIDEGLFLFEISFASGEEIGAVIFRLGVTDGSGLLATVHSQEIVLSEGFSSWFSQSGRGMFGEEFGVEVRNTGGDTGSATLMFREKDSARKFENPVLGDYYPVFALTNACSKVGENSDAACYIENSRLVYELPLPYRQYTGAGFEQRSASVKVYLNPDNYLEVYGGSIMEELRSVLLLLFTGLLVGVLFLNVRQRERFTIQLSEQKDQLNESLGKLSALRSKIFHDAPRHWDQVQDTLTAVKPAVENYDENGCLPSSVENAKWALGYTREIIRLHTTDVRQVVWESTEIEAQKDNPYGVALSSVADRALESAKKRFGETISASLEPLHSTSRAHGKAEHIYFILENLLKNAAQAALEVGPPGAKNMVHMLIDEGPSNVVRVNIWNRVVKPLSDTMLQQFFKYGYSQKPVSQDVLQEEGNGFGLYFSQEAAIGLGGKITVRNEEIVAWGGEGVWFTLELPLVTLFDDDDF